MCRLLNLVCIRDLVPERTFRFLMRFQATVLLPGNPPPFLVFDIEEEPNQEDRAMADNDIIYIANDRARNIGTM